VKEVSMRLLLRSRSLKDEAPGLLVGSNGDLNPVTLKTRDIGEYVEVIVIAGEAEKVEPKPRLLGRGPVVPIPEAIKDSLRERLKYRSLYEVAEKIGCSPSAVASLVNGQKECRQTLLGAIIDYLGDLANA